MTKILFMSQVGSTNACYAFSSKSAHSRTLYTTKGKMMVWERHAVYKPICTLSTQYILLLLLPFMEIIFHSWFPSLWTFFIIDVDSISIYNCNEEWFLVSVCYQVAYCSHMFAVLHNPVEYSFCTKVFDKSGWIFNFVKFCWKWKSFVKMDAIYGFLMMIQSQNECSRRFLTFIVYMTTLVRFFY